MNEAFAVEINKNTEHRFEHFASFGSPESALGNNLGKVFLGILHHHIETIPIFQPAAADVEYLQQIGMNELHDAAPERELEIGGGTRRDEFDGRSFGLRIGEMREENRGVVPTPSGVPHPESIINDLTFPLSPRLPHTPPPQYEF